MASAKRFAQRTVRDRVTLDGIGVHSGKPVSVTLHPADADTGIAFVLVDPDSGSEISIPARCDAVTKTNHCTVLGHGSGVFIATVEHLMATLTALGVDNVVIEADGSEVPIMDGSAAPFVDAIDRVGLVEQRSPRRFVKVLKPVQVKSGASFGALRPYDGRRFEIEIDFESPAIGRQAFACDLTPAVFRNELARARTFGFVSDVEKLWAAGLALGSSLENSVALRDDKVVNPEGLRYPNEFVRHKTLDAVGDLALAGAPILGLYHSYRGGHALNAAVVRALVADPDAWTMVEGETRRDAGHAELAAGVAAPVFRPDLS